MLAEELVCDKMEVVKHTVVENGVARIHHEVIRACTRPASCAAVGAKNDNCGMHVDNYGHGVSAANHRGGDDDENSNDCAAAAADDHGVGHDAKNAGLENAQPQPQEAGE